MASFLARAVGGLREARERVSPEALVAWQAARSRIGVACRLGNDQAPAAWSLLRDGVVDLARTLPSSGETLEPTDLDSAWSRIEAALPEAKTAPSVLALRGFLTDFRSGDPVDVDSFGRALDGARWLTRGLAPFKRRRRLLLTASALVLGVGIAVVLLPVLISENSLARRAHVTLSSTYPGAVVEPAALVDGKRKISYAVHTDKEQSPWVMLDLGEPQKIGRVVVFNRGDGWLEHCLPLVLETSEQGTEWSVVQVRNDVFTYATLWVAADLGARARYLRLRKNTPGYIALSRVEVYAE